MIYGMDVFLFVVVVDWQYYEYLIDLQICVEIDKMFVCIEFEYQVCVLFVCELGSWGWGFVLLDSDYDVCFIYVYWFDWYFIVFFGCDVIELFVNVIYDVSGWDLCKMLVFFYNGNVMVVEWLLLLVVYWVDVSFVDKINVVVELVYCLDCVFYYYLQMVCKNYCEYLKGECVCLKKYFYVLWLLMVVLWVEQQCGLVLMCFFYLVEVIVSDVVLCVVIDVLLVIKWCVGEVEEGVVILEINCFIELELQWLEQVFMLQKDVWGEYLVLDWLLWDVVMQGQ